MITDFRVEVISNETIAMGRSVINSLSDCEVDAVDFTDDEKFFDMLNAKVNVARVVVFKRNHGDNSKSLSQKFFLSPEVAKRTLQHTTQRGIRKILHPSSSRQFKINDQVLGYNILNHNFFTDTIHAVIIS